MKSVLVALLLAVGSDVRPYAVAGSAPCAEGLCEAAALAPYFERLEQVAAGGAPPVHILQIGDSHSATDHFTGSWRAILQGRFGDGQVDVRGGEPWFTSRPAAGGPVGAALDGCRYGSVSGTLAAGTAATEHWIACAVLTLLAFVMPSWRLPSALRRVGADD